MVPLADFTTVEFQFNQNTNASPTWTNILGASKELRFHDTNAAGLSTASASWPSVTRPAATAGIDYAYGYTADAVGLGVLGSGGAPEAFNNAHYLQYRWSWDNVGSFASAPIFTAYKSTSHDSPARGDNSILGGNATDTGATARSYLKGNLFGRPGSAGAPAAAPGASPTVTDGTTGAATPTAGANWLTASSNIWQGLQGDNDWLAAPFTPAPTTADVAYVMLRMFTGPHEDPAVYTPTHSLRYTFT